MDSVHFCADTKLSRDVVIHPHVVFGIGVTVDEGVEIRSFSHIEQSHLKRGAVIGPFARLRPGSVVGEEASVGNFVEIKKSTLGKFAKVNHLSYIGDSDIGASANIGAGTITCNYDGREKHKTVVGDHAFIGSNSSLIAPVKIGRRATVGAGSAISQDVPDDALAISRSEQINKPGRAKAPIAMIKDQ